MRKPHERAKIFWYPPLQKWAIIAPALKPVQRSREFTVLIEMRFDAQYHANGKVWSFDENHIQEIKKFAEQFYGSVDFNPAKPEMPKVPTRIQEKDYLEIFCSLAGAQREQITSKQEAHKVWRKAAARLHSDVGGNHGDAASLNEAYREIQQSLAE